MNNASIKALRPLAVAVAASVLAFAAQAGEVEVLHWWTLSLIHI